MNSILCRGAPRALCARTKPRTLNQKPVSLKYKNTAWLKAELEFRVLGFRVTPWALRKNCTIGCKLV